MKIIIYVENIKYCYDYIGTDYIKCCLCKYISKSRIICCKEGGGCVCYSELT
jgi:hypothetical protein